MVWQQVLIVPEETLKLRQPQLGQLTKQPGMSEISKGNKKSPPRRLGWRETAIREQWDSISLEMSCQYTQAVQAAGKPRRGHVTDVLNNSKTWILTERRSHRNKGIDTQAFQKWKTNFLSTEPKEHCFLSLLLGSGNELWSWERASAEKEQHWVSAVFNNSVPWTDTSTGQASILSAGRAALI